MSDIATALPKRQTRKWNKKQKDHLFVFLMLFLPTVQFILFWIVPNFNSLVLAFKLPSAENGGVSFVNFQRFWKELNEPNSSLLYSIIDTLVYFLVTTLVNLPIVTFLSYVLFKKVPFAKAFRVIFYLPAILGGTVTAAMIKKPLKNFSLSFWARVGFIRASPCPKAACPIKRLIRILGLMTIIWHIGLWIR